MPYVAQAVLSGMTADVAGLIQTLTRHFVVAAVGLTILLAAFVVARGWMMVDEAERKFAVRSPLLWFAACLLQGI